LFLFVKVGTAFFIPVPQHAQMFLLCHKADAFSPCTQDSANRRYLYLDVAEILA
jgi:hypothetical protein